MKEMPILFSGEMVRAILEGRKTQTRRMVKEPICIDKETYAGAGLTWYGNYGLRKPCKFGKAGDRLWVKETFFMFGDKPIYRADCQRDSKDNSDWWVTDGLMIPCLKWKSSLFMPRTLSRITLEIVSVRVERLQAISEEDAKAEGTTPFCGDDCAYLPVDLLRSTQYLNVPCYRIGYFQLWESINGKGSWQANPFVWVIEFKMI